MELKKANLSGTTSESGLGLQHEAAMRVEARYLAEERRRRHLQRMERLKVFLLFLLFLAAALGGGYYAYSTSRRRDSLRRLPLKNQAPKILLPR